METAGMANLVKPQFTKLMAAKDPEKVTIDTWNWMKSQTTKKNTFSIQETLSAMDKINFNKGIGGDGFNGEILKDD